MPIKSNDDIYDALSASMSSAIQQTVLTGTGIMARQSGNQRAINAATLAMTQAVAPASQIDDRVKNLLPTIERRLQTIEEKLGADASAEVKADLDVVKSMLVLAGVKIQTPQWAKDQALAQARTEAFDDAVRNRVNQLMEESNQNLDVLHARLNPQTVGRI